MVSLIAYADGRFKAGALDFIRSLPGYFSPAPFYEIKDGQQFTKTKDLNSIAATISFVGSTAQVRKSAMRLIEAVNDGKIFDYSVPNGFLKRCSHIVGNYFSRGKFVRLLRRFFLSKHPLQSTCQEIQRRRKGTFFQQGMVPFPASGRSLFGSDRHLSSLVY